MNLNIALNTIIYIMVFLFPGVLFRRFYFSSKHKVQFHQGNLFERFITTIILSIFCIILYTLFFEYLLSDILGFRILNKISYDSFYSLFSNLSKNETPEYFKSSDNFKDFIFLLVTIYITSTVFGALLYHIVTGFGLDKMISFLRFSNEWDYLFYAPTKDIRKKKNGKIIYTNIDIMTKINSTETLFQGGLYKVLYNKDNDLESISIRNAQKFLILNKKDDSDTIKYIEDSIERGEFTYVKYRDTSNSVTFKKSINSDIFVINKSEIINYNILYLTKNVDSELNQNTIIFISRILLMIALLIIIALFAFPFITMDNNVFFDSVGKRIGFSLYTFTQGVVIVGSIANIINKKGKLITNLLMVGFFSVFYLWFFDIMSFWTSVLTGVAILISIIIFGKKDN